MGQKMGGEGQMMKVLFTMLLFLVFVLCTLFTVLIGGRVYENISIRMEENDTGSTALNYVANKVRQGDRAGMAAIRQIDGTQVLQLKQVVNGVSYITWIYYRNGNIMELFTNEDSGLSLDDGLEIMECGGLEFTWKGSLLKITTVGNGGGSLQLAFRSGGPGDE